MRRIGFVDAMEEKMHLRYYNKYKVKNKFVHEGTLWSIDTTLSWLLTDQEKFQLERELVTVRTRLEEETRLKDEAKTRSEELEQRLNQSDTEVQNAKARINALSREIQQ